MEERLEGCWGEEGGRVNSGAMAGVQADQPRPEPGQHQKQQGERDKSGDILDVKSEPD